MSDTANTMPKGQPSEAMRDWELVARIGDGDDKSFNEVVLRYKGPVHRFVYRMLGNAADAEDVAADVFVRAYHAIQRRAVRQGNGVFASWLFQVARNAALDRLRYRRRHPVESLAALEDEGQSLIGPGATPAAEMLAAETGRAVADAVALLPEEQRVAVVLAEYDNWSYAEIAAVLKCTPKSVETRLYRARLFLRHRLAHLLRD